MKTYSFNSLLCEEVEDGEHNRNINLLEINVDSNLQDEINESISSKFMDEYNSYMKKAPYEFQYKTIDTTYTEKDNILYIAVASNLPSQYVAPYITECVYYDLAKDKCYSFDELLEKIDIDKITLQTEAAEMIHKNVGDSYTCSLAGLFYDKTGNMLIIINTEDTNPEGVGTSETLFYDYTNKKLSMTGDFSGFDSIKWLNQES
jgi:hypothetical protein